MLANTLIDISLADAGICALLGYAVVFFGLILLMVVMILFSKLFTVEEKKIPPVAVQAPAATPEAASAPGSAGKLKLYNTDPKTAAMLMAIVADKLQKPINELRFISIKEVE